MKRALALLTTGVVAAAMILVAAPAAHAEACGPEPTMPPWNGVYVDETGLHLNYGEVPNDVLGAAWWARLWIQNYIDCEVMPFLPMEAVDCLRDKEIVVVETKPTPRVGNRYVHVGTETVDVNFPLLMQDIADCTGG
ncbi:MAG TPA: hypothetical protein VEU29_03345 [Actinomycetota bacterium]|nr:hypothetical protein [Actinomycetota bacterium]